MIIVNKKTFSVIKIEKNCSHTYEGEAVSYAGFRICIVLHGSAIWQINGTDHPVTEGDIIFLGSRQRRRFSRISEGGIDIGVFMIDRQIFTSIKHFSFFLTFISEYNGVMHDEKLAQILKEIYVEAKENEDSNYELISALLTEFFIKAERKYGFDEKAIVKIDKTIINVLDYIDEHIGEKISLAAIAAYAGFTESSFSRWFAKQIGVSYKKFVMSKKIERAILLLETTDLKVVDIACECGFDSISGFHDAFRKITGTTPNKFTHTV